MENNLGNKAKFFAQYWGQEVIGDVNNAGQNVIYPIERSNMYRIEESHLVLKPLSSITDEDLEKSVITKKQLKKYVSFPWVMTPFISDYLRSKGYAIPYMGLSVETMVKYGWIKLI